MVPSPLNQQAKLYRLSYHKLPVQQTISTHWLKFLCITKSLCVHNENDNITHDVVPTAETYVSP
jgi:hypothetical protein